MNLSLRSWVGIASLVAFCGVALGGCVISPRPEPPDQQRGLPQVQPDDLSQQISNGTYSIELVAGPGTVEPPGALVRITLLDSQEPPYDVLSDDQGGFSVDLPLAGGDEFRLQVVTDQGRSLPLDLVAAAGPGKPQLAQHALGDCWSVPTTMQLDASGQLSVRLVNSCNFGIHVIRPRTRTTVPSVSVGADSTWPQTIDPGQSVDVTVQVSTQGTFEQVVFFEADAPQQDRRALTVYRD